MKKLKKCGIINYKGENSIFQKTGIFGKKNQRLKKMDWRNKSKGGGRVFTEELNVIRQAEEDAEKIKKDARTEARKMVDKANTEAGGLINRAEEEAKDCFEGLVKEGQETAQKAYEQAICEAEKSCQKMAEEAGRNQDRIVKFISERIVKSSVNC